MQRDNISSEVIQMLVSSITDQGRTRLDSIAAERFLNALTRAQSGVPTGTQSMSENDRKI